MSSEQNSGLAETLATVDTAIVVSKPFVVASKFILDHEKGVSNDPHDNGGLTVDGITQATYDVYIQSAVSEDNYKLVTSMTDEERASIYYSIWQQSRGSDMPPLTSIVHMDFCFNSGVRRASRVLQELLGVKVDGIVGPITLSALKHVDDLSLAKRLLEARVAFYVTIVKNNPTQITFLRGWMNRMMDLRECIVTNKPVQHD